MAEASGILKRAFAELEQVFQGASNQIGNGSMGANGKSTPSISKRDAKAAEKEDARLEKAEAGQQDGKGNSKGGKEDKKKKQKVPVYDENGQELKRPLSAYMLYNNHRRPILRAEHPELTLTDLSKLIGEEWKKLNELQKKPWEERAKSMRLEYEIKCYNAKRQPDADSETSNAKRPKPTGNPEGMTNMASAAAPNQQPITELSDDSDI